MNPEPPSVAYCRLFRGAPMSRATMQASASQPDQQQGLHVYAAATPNGHKATIALAELGVPHTMHKIDLAAGDQKKPDFLKMNPAGRTPVLVDYDASPADGGSPPFVLAESGAILFYLADRDPSHTLLPADRAARAETLSWVFFKSAHLGMPTYYLCAGLMFGVPYSAEIMKTAVEDTHAAFKLLDARLAHTGGWLAAGRYSVADVACISSVLYCSNLLGINLKHDYPSLGAWLDRALSRPAVRQGLTTPEPCPFLGSDGQGSGARRQVMEAAQGRLAKLGVHLGSACAKASEA